MKFLILAYFLVVIKSQNIENEANFENFKPVRGFSVERPIQENEAEFEEINDERAAAPTLHRIKQKIHTHIHGHGIHSNQKFTSTIPLVSPIQTGQHINTQQYGVISPILRPGIQNLNQNQFIQNFQYPLQNLHGVSNSYPNQNLHGISTTYPIQNLQHGIQNTGGIRNDAIQIANVNGHNNVVQQLSQNPHIFSSRRPVLPEDSIRNAEKSGESEMDNVLTALDERSYLQKRPEVDISPYFEKNEVKEKEMNCLCVDENGKSKEIVGKPNLIQVPSNNYQVLYSDYHRYKRNSDYNDTLNNYTEIIENYRKTIKQNEEKIVADFFEGFVNDYRNKKITNDIKKINKRSAPIVQLFKDPNMQMDVPQTLENIGAITKNAFEDEKAPMYHVRNFMGSTKNAVLSALRIPPQNLIIPSNYEVKNVIPEEIQDENEENVGAINGKLVSRDNFEENHDPYGIVDTFTRVGGAIRDSVRSSQNTLNHIGDIAHNARKVFHTTKNTVPRIILPYRKAPVMIKNRNNENFLKKSVIISPRIVDVKPLLGSPKTEPNYVKMGTILDAIGISKPDKDDVHLEKIIVRSPGNPEIKGIYIPPVGDVKSINGVELPSLKNHDEMVSKSIDNGIKPIESRSNFGTKKSRNTLERKHFTKQEEDKIIDEFLQNIFKIDGKTKFSSHLAGDELNLIPQQSKFGVTERELKNMIKEITNEVIKEDLNAIPKNSLKKTKFRKLKKNYHKSEPKIMLRNRFGKNNESEEITTFSPKINENDDEAIKKIDEYVANDLISPNRWKNGHVLEIIGDENPPHSSRNLLWTPENSNEEIVGLDLPPELMKPFMARVSNSEAENVFDKNENVGMKAPNEENFPENSLKNDGKFDDNFPDNDRKFGEIPPSELMRKMIEVSSEKPREFSVTENILCSSDPNNPVLCGNSRENSNENVGQSRTSMVVNENLKKPFMGMGNEQMIQNYYDEYNRVNYEILNDNYNNNNNDQSSIEDE